MLDEEAEQDDDDSLPLRELLRITGGMCVDCRQAYSAREAVFSIVLGFKAAPRCLGCLADRLGRDVGELRMQLVQYVHGRECFLKAWKEAERMDGPERPPASEGLPPSAGGGRAGEVHPESRVSPGSVGASPPQNAGGTGVIRPPLAQAADTWDAGDMGCGELVMALRLRMNALPPGGVIRVTATDPAAPEDLPAWCRMTGHPLLSTDHPIYVIQRKGA